LALGRGNPRKNEEILEQTEKQKETQKEGMLSRDKKPDPH